LEKKLYERRKKKFVRIKETLYSYNNGKIKVSIKPYEEYIMFDISKAWFLSRARGKMGELILNEHYLTITFRSREKIKTKGSIAWDCNEKSLDGFNPRIEKDKITKDLTLLFHIHRAYEIKRKKLQSLASKKIRLKKILQKYSRRERNRAKDFVHKLTKEISRELKKYVHGFEDLRKENMFSYSKEHNRRIAKINWKMIVSFMSYKSKVKFLNPKNSTRRCSRCGKINAPKGAL
jgi:putative transposase